MLFGSRRMATADVDGGIEARFMLGVLPSAPRVEAREHRGEWLVLHWYEHQDGAFVRAISRIEAEGDRVARLRNYFFTSDIIAEVCAELGVPFRVNGHRWWLQGCP
jgi:RNA polymerase sigma-70 factor (ECF subfamily)